MARGRPKINEDLNALRGNPGKRKRKPAPDKGSIVRFQVPKYRGVKLKQRLQAAADFLFENKISFSSDVEAWQRYCQHAYNAAEAFKIIKQEGLIELDQNMQNKNHPAVKLHKDSSVMCLKFEEQFGLTPLARQKVKGSAGMQKDPLKEFMDAGKKLGVVK